MCMAFLRTYLELIGVANRRNFALAQVFKWTIRDAWQSQHVAASVSLKRCVLQVTCQLWMSKHSV